MVLVACARDERVPAGWVWLHSSFFWGGQVAGGMGRSHRQRGDGAAAGAAPGVRGQGGHSLRSEGDRGDAARLPGAATTASRRA